MRRLRAGVVGLALLTVACEGVMDPIFDSTDPPRDLDGWYYDGAVELHWRLGSRWNGEAFRVFGKRSSAAQYSFLAEVTSCGAGVCAYRDLNVLPDVTYEYYVAAVSGDGTEVASERSVEVYVPPDERPATPQGLTAVGLDGAVYLHWIPLPRVDQQVWTYRVHEFVSESHGFAVGAGYSSSFLIEAPNGVTRAYSVSAVDQYGRESPRSHRVTSTPRLDYVGEYIYSRSDVLDSSGFRFRASEDSVAVMSSDDPDRHFALDGDSLALWLVPGPGAGVNEPRPTSALKCGPGADGDCVSWERAPTRGYSSQAIEAVAGYTYMFRVPGEKGVMHYASVRISTLAVDQEGRSFIIFDWAYQTQAGNPSLLRAGGSSR